MKRKFLVLSTVLALAAGSLAACGNTENAAEAPVQEEAATQDSTEAAEATEAATQETAEIANPWVEITEDEAKELCFRLFKAPEGAENITWRKCESLADADKGIGPMIQLDFTLDNNNFTARAQQGASEDTDIAGNFVEWTVGPEDCTLANWGGGNMAGKTYRSINDAGYVDQITWYDIEVGISYSLSVAAADLDGFDIQAVAEQMYSEESEAEEASGMYEDFLQQQTGKTSFESYDEIISALKAGQGYAYIKLQGSDEDVLAVTDLVFEADHTAYEISLYSKSEGEIKSMGLVTGNGSAYPLRLEDGIIYAGDNHSYETYFLSQEYGSLMMKDSISDGVNSGTNELSGFTREKNTFDDTTDYTGTMEDFEKLIQERDKKPVIEFTVIE